MINNYKKQYIQFNLYQCFSRHITCNENNNIDLVFTLTEPKVISNLVNNILPLNESLPTLDHNFIDLKENNNNNNLNNVNRFDKKNKNVGHLEDILDIRKKKNKLQKKNRKQNVLESDELFINKSTGILLNEENLNNDVIKVPKISKNKKKNDNKITINEIKDIQETNNDNIYQSFSKEIVLHGSLSIQELSDKLNIPEAEIIKYLFLKGITVTINQVIDTVIIKDIASNYGILIKENVPNKAINTIKLANLSNDSSQKLIERPPIITILGHVDHGKTTLLDAILQTDLVKKEFGGITQAIANYEVEFLNEKKLYKLVFLDTPGHEAFASIRARGTEVTDIILLVVAADDSLKPQTLEAIDYIIDNNLSYIVVINKVDKPDINTFKLREALTKYNIIDQSLGGDATIVEVSALKKQNINTLLSQICLLSSLKELKANPDQLATGTIIETYLDIKRGPVAILVIQNGSLKIGDFIVAGNLYAKVKIISNNTAEKLKSALPSSIVQILGFSTLPQAGESFYVVNNKKCAEYEVSLKQVDNQKRQLNNLSNRITWNSNSNTVSNLKTLNLILKTDAQGSSEAIIKALNNISQSKVQINILQLNFGNISSTDVELASTTNSIIVGFNVNIVNKAYDLAKQLNIAFKTFNIIYEIIDHITINMLHLVEPEYDKLMIGKAIVQNVFYMNKGCVAGCIVTEGKLAKNASVYIYRNSAKIHSSILNSLKRMKDDVNEVLHDTECGVMCYDYNFWNIGDVIEAYELKEKEKVL